MASERSYTFYKTVVYLFGEVSRSFGSLVSKMNVEMAVELMLVLEGR